MLRDDRGTAMVVDHLGAWLAPELGTGESSVEQAMLDQARTFIEQIYRNGGSVAELLTHTASPLRAELGEIYGLRSPTKALTWRTTEHRHGLLTLPAFLASRRSIVKRGLFVAEQLLCRGTPPPPPGADTTVPPPRAGESMRARFARHTTDPACRSCHARIDVLGFAFEHYDETGRHRLEDGDEPVDASGSVVVDGLERTFGHFGELAPILAQSHEVHRCWTWQWVRRLLPAEHPRSRIEVFRAIPTRTSPVNSGGSMASRAPTAASFRSAITPSRSRFTTSVVPFTERRTCGYRSTRARPASKPDRSCRAPRASG